MVCPDCARGAIHTHATPQGKTITLHGRTCYISLPPSTTSPKNTIIFLCDAFSLSLPNNLLLCDLLASTTNARVFAPDYFPGKPLDTAVLGYMDRLLTQSVHWWDIWGQVVRILTALRVLWLMVGFSLRCRQGKTVVIANDFVRAVRAEMSGQEKIGVAGFCWGGYAATKLCTEETEKGKGLIDVAYVAHPSGMKVPDMIVDAVGAFGTKYALAIGDGDWLVKKADVLNIEAALRTRFGEPEEGGYQVRVYEGCGHGFVIRAVPGIHKEALGMDSARKQASDWFNEHFLL